VRVFREEGTEKVERERRRKKKIYDREGRGGRKEGNGVEK